jgi:cytochrome c peroxidase
MKKLPLFAVLAAVTLTAGTIDLNNLDTYASQTVPNYIRRDNTPANNQISNRGAALGRVLFYDKNLSANNTVACASCHQQQFAFGDTAQLSLGFMGGRTGRHSMRLVNARFGEEANFFWDERAISLEDQTTHPIQDATEMGFSGSNGQPDLDSLIRKLEAIPYYTDLFTAVYGDAAITEDRMQKAFAQFIRSIQSFDSKFDTGLAAANGNINANFTNFSTAENAGKALFLAPPPQGGAGCQGCHRAPEFDIDPASLNNGVTAVAGSATLTDLTNTRAPSLRNLLNPNGVLNGPLMHNGNFNTLAGVVAHYNLVPQNASNTNRDPRVTGAGGSLGLTQGQRDNIVAFLGTLTGSDVYTNPKWSNPFDSLGNITVIPLTVGTVEQVAALDIQLFPNPITDYLRFNLSDELFQVAIFTANGQMLMQKEISGSHYENMENYPAGTYIVQVRQVSTGQSVSKKIVKF